MHSQDQHEDDDGDHGADEEGSEDAGGDEQERCHSAGNMSQWERILVVGSQEVHKVIMPVVHRGRQSSRRPRSNPRSTPSTQNSVGYSTRPLSMRISGGP